MINNTINDDKPIAGGEDMVLAGRYYCSLSVWVVPHWIGMVGRKSTVGL